MEEAEYKSPPGLKRQQSGYFWRQSDVAKKRGYPVKSVNLTKLKDDPKALYERCVRLQREQSDWLTNGSREAVVFDGTFGTLLKLYETDPESSYFKLKASSKHPYTVYLGMLRVQIAHCRLEQTPGLELRRWFKGWCEPLKEGSKRTVAKARAALNVIKAAVAYGVEAGLPGVDKFKAMLDGMKFERPKPRTSYANAEIVTRLRGAAHRLGQPRAALAYALQFESTLRQWDARGQWVDLSDPRPSAVIYRGKKWVGLSWANIDQNLILRLKPTKTEDTTEFRAVHDLKIYPMVMEELQRIPVEQRHGPLLIDVRTGRPWSNQSWTNLWRDVCDMVGGVDSYELWNRDLRASGATESKSGNVAVSNDDLSKVMGNTPRVADEVYDRAMLEAQRRFAEARQAARKTARNS